MTQNEIRVLVERGLHTQGFRRYANLDVKILNLYLNKSMNEYLDSVLMYLRGGVGFEDSTVSITDLEDLKGTNPLAKVAPTTFLSGESYLIAAKTGDVYRDWVKFTTEITSDYYTSAQYIKVRIVDGEFVDDLFQDGYHTTSYKSPIGIIEGGEVKVYKNDDFTLGDGSLTYLKVPTAFDVVTKATDTYPLNNRIVNTVIDLTVRAMLVDRQIIAVKQQQQQNT